MASNEVLQIVVFSVLFGAAASSLGSKVKKLIDALDEAHGNKSVAARLLAMPTSLPKDPEVDPPELLDEVMDALYWDFLGAMDGENLRCLQDAEEHTEKKLRDFEERSFFVEKKLAVHMRELRQERRRGEASPDRRVQIDAILARLERIGDQFAADMRKYMSTLRGDNEELREAIFSALTDHGEVEHLYTIHWTVRRNRWGMVLRFPVFQEEPYSVEAWRNRDEPGISFGNVEEELGAIRFGDQQG